MNNLQKRTLTSLVALPLSIFFVVKGGYFLLFFLIFIFFAGIYEQFNVFKKTSTRLFLSLFFGLAILIAGPFSEKSFLIFHLKID